MSTTNCNGSSDPSDAPIPASLTVSSFAGARIKEIQAMRKCITESSGTKMAFQRLPKHMRRRAMSHVVKRLPRRLREIHINQMKKSGLPPKSKRPSRRYRRRPLNLQSDYARRQRRIKWLNTHIWHAKRFHMIEKWGFKLPKQPCDKSFRACYRATSKHCLVQDLSYYRCIEIIGPYEEITASLSKITNSKTGLTFGAKCYYEGKKFGQATIFDPNVDSCRKAIGPVQFFWKSISDTNKRNLWIFVHPAYYKQLLNIFISLFSLKPESNNEMSTFVGVGGIIIRELEYELSKFRLTGPLSTAVLKNALKVVDLNDMANLPNCFKQFSLETLSVQNSAFKDLTDSSCCPPNLVHSVIVYDPRLNLPRKRIKSVLNTASFDVQNFDQFQRNLSLSPLFDDSVRTFVKENKLPNSKLSELRSQQLIPGSDITLENISMIPVILLWRPGSKASAQHGYSSGWDIVLPSSWAQCFFLSLVMWGARVGGLRETESIAFEGSQCDMLQPDTVAGEQEENDISEQFQERYFRLPPNKRTNFNKFGIASPFSFNWKLLISEWSESSCRQFSVLRDKGLLKRIQDYFTSKEPTLPLIPQHCLVPVRIIPENKGCCVKFTLICLPNSTDGKTTPVEPTHKDLLASKRKSLRREHKNLLLKLRRRRKRASKLGKPITPTDKTLLIDYKNQMRKLWLPEPMTIRNSCSRQVIGFVKTGDFAFTLGRSKGLGYVVGDALTTLPKNNKVLIRNTNSREYIWAVISTIVE